MRNIGCMGFFTDIGTLRGAGAVGGTYAVGIYSKIRTYRKLKAI